MKYPLDSSDEASLILADYLEEYDNINLANEVRNSVLEPNINIWHWKYISNINVIIIFGNDVGWYGHVGWNGYPGSESAFANVNTVGAVSNVGN